MESRGTVAGTLSLFGVHVHVSQLDVDPFLIHTHYTCAPFVGPRKRIYVFITSHPSYV